MNNLPAIDQLLQLMESNLVGLTFISALLCYFLATKQAYFFSAITFIFFFVGSSLNNFLIEIDPEFIFRYIVWAINDIAWMAVIAYLTMKDKIHLWQSIFGQLIVLPAPLLQLVRLVDRHYFDLSYTDYFYRGLLPLINTATVFLCFAPLIVIFTQYLRNKNLEEEVEG